MQEMVLARGSLVLYKRRAAQVTALGRKVEIVLDAGTRLSVRPKDILLLHPGPLASLGQLQPLSGEVETAWELLAGQVTSLKELAELVYGAFTPATAWATWQLLDDGLYFQGDLEAIVARAPHEVEAERAVRAAKAAEEVAWAAFTGRLQRGQYGAEDEPYLLEITQLALGQASHSQVLGRLGREENSQNAHALLLELGYWDETVNPYPSRFGLELSPPTCPLPALPAEERRDLTHLPALAIDDAGSSDPDDALSLEGDCLWVHIADVAALIPPDSPADREARARGANLYLPEGTGRMLPAAATESLALGLSHPSPALSFRLRPEEGGTANVVEIVPSWVNVTRLTYEEAESQLHSQPLAALWRLAQQAEARRLAQGAVQIDLPEVKIRLVDGQVMITPLPALRSRRLVQEAMLWVGEAVARYAQERQIPIPYTSQEQPRATNGPAAETVEAVDRGGGVDYAGMFALRRRLSRSQQHTGPAPHPGLGLELYTQATSPLRRYLDLVAHQQLRACLRGGPVLDEAAILARIGATEAANASLRQAERLSNQHWTLVYLRRRPAWQGEAIVLEQRGARSHLLFPELGLETQLYLRQQWPLNSLVRLRLAGVNLPALEASFQED